MNKFNKKHPFFAFQQINGMSISTFHRGHMYDLYAVALCVCVCVCVCVFVCMQIEMWKRGTALVYSFAKNPCASQTPKDAQ